MKHGKDTPCISGGQLTIVAVHLTRFLHGSSKVPLSYEELGFGLLGLPLLLGRSLSDLLELAGVPDATIVAWRAGRGRRR